MDEDHLEADRKIGKAIFILDSLTEEDTIKTKRLQLAEAVCESINEFDPHGEYWNQDALDAWRKSKEGK